MATAMSLLSLVLKSKISADLAYRSTFQTKEICLHALVVMVLSESSTSSVINE
jgi:hypothetical protein